MSQGPSISPPTGFWSTAVLERRKIIGNEITTSTETTIQATAATRRLAANPVSSGSSLTTVRNADHGANSHVNARRSDIATAAAILDRRTHPAIAVATMTINPHQITKSSTDAKASAIPAAASVLWIMFKPRFRDQGTVNPVYSVRQLVATDVPTRQSRPGTCPRRPNSSAETSLHKPEMRSAAVPAIRSAKSQNRGSAGSRRAIYAALVVPIRGGQHNTHQARSVARKQVIDVPVPALPTMHMA